MLKKMASISYAQLLASLRGQADSQPTSEPKATQIEATTEAMSPEKTSEDSVDAPDDSGIAAEEVESAEATKEPDAESDIASSRSQSPIPRPRTPHPPQEISIPSEIAPSSTSKPQSPSKPPMEERKELNEEQKYQAKVLILDLLGWGVSPDYMLQRGISHELVCSVFNELRLRLPENIAADYAAIANTHSR